MVLLITISPIICYANIIETELKEVPCVRNPQDVKWIEIFLGRPDARAALITNGLLMTAPTWSKLFDKRQDVEYALDEAPFSAIDGIDDPSRFSEISKIRTVGFTGLKLRFEKDCLPLRLRNNGKFLSLWFPGNNEFVSVTAVCTKPPSPAIPFSDIPKTEDQKVWDDLVSKVAVVEEEVPSYSSYTDMWPINTEIACDKGFGISLKFDKPNGDPKTELILVH